MGVNKVVLGEENLIDLTSDTVSENNLLSGATAHAANGEQIKGNVVVPSEMNDLSDVNFSNPSDGQIIKYNASKGKWENVVDDSVVTPVNNLLATKPGKPLDAVQGKTLDDKISELNSSLPDFIYDETGQITGYKTEIGGADTVFPFSSIKNKVYFYNKGVINTEVIGNITGVTTFRENSLYCSKTSIGFTKSVSINTDEYNAFIFKITPVIQGFAATANSTRISHTCDAEGYYVCPLPFSGNINFSINSGTTYEISEIFICRINYD